ncbi:hypothetical protein TNCV_4550651 [Trichonephila clavipes]|nr:hypothetical protein TNCV_4550651 [Trichonephila clavipes]
MKEGKERLEVPDPLQDIISQIWDGTEPKIVLSPIWCSNLSLMPGAKKAPCHVEFRGPRSETFDQVASEAPTGVRGVSAFTLSYPPAYRGGVRCLFLPRFLSANLETYAIRNIHDPALEGDFLRGTSQLFIDEETRPQQEGVD